MGNLYENMDREQKIIKHAATNNMEVRMQLCTENCVMFTVNEKHLDKMKKFCEEQFGSCEIVEEVGSIKICKVV